MSDLPVVGRLFAKNHKETQADRRRADADAANHPRARSHRRRSAAVPRRARQRRRRLRAAAAARSRSRPPPQQQPRRRRSGRAAGPASAGTRARTDPRAQRRPRRRTPAPTDAAARTPSRRRRSCRRRRPLASATTRADVCTASAEPVRAGSAAYQPRRPLARHDARRGLQALDDVRVAALDGLERARACSRPSAASAAAISAMPERRSRLSRSRPRSFVGPGHDDAVRIAEEEVGAHAAELLEREQPQLVHPVVDQRLALACVASTVTRLTMSLGNPGQRPVVSGGSLDARLVRS